MSGNGAFGSHSGPRAAINAWLEEISFRTGVIAGAVVLVMIAAVGGAVAVFGHGGQAASALGSRGTANPGRVAPSAAPTAVVAARPSATPGSAAPAKSAAATSAPARSAAASAPGTGSAPAAGSGSAAVTAASGSGRESSGLASPVGWRHGFPPVWGGRGWVWGPYRGGPHFGGPWW